MELQEYAPTEYFVKYVKPELDIGENESAQPEKKNRSKKPGHHRRALIERYGLTESEYESMWQSQQGLCAICKRPEPESIRARLCIDHCHDTGRVRGLLCGFCNTGLGGFRDNVESLRSAIAYLESAAI